MTPWAVGFVEASAWLGGVCRRLSKYSPKGDKFERFGTVGHHTPVAAGISSSPPEPCESSLLGEKREHFPRRRDPVVSCCKMADCSARLPALKLGPLE